MISYDPTSAVPAYEQIRSRVADGAASGELPAGTRLPAVRRLAADLGISPNTVARAYRELEHSGIVETSGRGGTVIAGDASGTVEARVATAEHVRRLRALGVGDDAVVELLLAELGRR